MPAWPRDRLPWIVLTVQGTLLAMAGLHLGKPLQLSAFALIAALALWQWLWQLRKSRAILDTPTSRIGSAAQGYVELLGTAQPLAGQDLVSPMTGLPCLWYRYQLYYRNNTGWQLQQEAQSDAAFMLDDGSGRCRIDPLDAEIRATHKETRQLGERRYTEWLLLKGDRLYALGQFSSHSGSHLILDERRDLDGLLTDWKADQQALHARFDLDGDRKLSEAEWALAKASARRALSAHHAQLRLRPLEHSLGKPADGRPYLIANESPDHLGRTYARWSGLQLLILLAVLLYLSWQGAQLV